MSEQRKPENECTETCYPKHGSILETFLFISCSSFHTTYLGPFQLKVSIEKKHGCSALDPRNQTSSTVYQLYSDPSPTLSFSHSSFLAYQCYLKGSLTMKTACWSLASYVSILVTRLLKSSDNISMVKTCKS